MGVVGTGVFVGAGVGVGGIGVAVGGTGVGVGGTGVGVACGVAVTTITTGVGVACGVVVTTMTTGVGVAAGAPHPPKSDATNVMPIICCSNFCWFIFRSFLLHSGPLRPISDTRTSGSLNVNCTNLPVENSLCHQEADGGFASRHGIVSSGIKRGGSG